MSAATNSASERNADHFAQRGCWIDDERFVCLECWQVRTIDQAIVVDGDRYSTCQTCEQATTSGTEAS